MFNNEIQWVKRTICYLTKGQNKQVTKSCLIHPGNVHITFSVDWCSLSSHCELYCLLQFFLWQPPWSWQRSRVDSLHCLLGGVSTAVECLLRFFGVKPYSFSMTICFWHMAHILFITNIILTYSKEDKLFDLFAIQISNRF